MLLPCCFHAASQGGALGYFVTPLQGFIGVPLRGVIMDQFLLRPIPFPGF